MTLEKGYCPHCLNKVLMHKEKTILICPHCGKLYSFKEGKDTFITQKEKNIYLKSFKENKLLNETFDNYIKDKYKEDSKNTNKEDIKIIKETKKEENEEIKLSDFKPIGMMLSFVVFLIILYGVCGILVKTASYMGNYVKDNLTKIEEQVNQENMETITHFIENTQKVNYESTSKTDTDRIPVEKLDVKVESDKTQEINPLNAICFISGILGTFTLILAIYQILQGYKDDDYELASSGKVLIFVSLSLMILPMYTM